MQSACPLPRAAHLSQSAADPPRRLIISRPEPAAGGARGLSQPDDKDPSRDSATTFSPERPSPSSRLTPPPPAADPFPALSPPQAERGACPSRRVKGAQPPYRGPGVSRQIPFPFRDRMVGSRLYEGEGGGSPIPGALGVSPRTPSFSGVGWGGACLTLRPVHAFSPERPSPSSRLTPRTSRSNLSATCRA